MLIATTPKLNELKAKVDLKPTDVPWTKSFVYLSEIHSYTEIYKTVSKRCVRVIKLLTEDNC